MNIFNYKKPTLWIIIAALILCVVVAVCFFTSPEKNEESESTTEETNNANATDATVETEPTPETYPYVAEGYSEVSPGVYLKTVTGTTDAGEYTGYLMLCTDPSRVKVVDTYRQFECGEQVSGMIERAGAVAGIDGGGFVDGADYLSNGGTPYGFLIEDGIMVNEAADGYGHLVGINNDNEMVVGSYSTEEVLDLDLRSAVVAEAILIEDGELSPDAQKGWGLAPRTALGQRETGEIIFLVVDGRQQGYSFGCDVDDLQSILLDEGCVNAAMIDGGSSSVMETATYSDSGECTVELVNKPHLGPTLESQRYINNAWVIMPE